METTQLAKSVNKSDGVIAAMKQCCLQTLSKHGERGRRSTTRKVAINDALIQIQI